MIAQIEYNGALLSINLDNGIDLSIRNDFSGNSPIFYKSEHPSLKTYSYGNFIGDLKKGGSCNVNQVNLNIHCTGTHTESIAHIFDSDETISDVCPIGLVPAFLVTTDLQEKSQTDESYHCDFSDELLITERSLRKKSINSCDALIVRSLPNDSSKKNKNYDVNPAPFFTNDAIDYINKLNVKHLLVDIPSIDKADDGGELGNHKRFFKQGKTISELLYIPNNLRDGFGFLSIQIPNWALDAAPSRPIFYPT